MEVEPPAVVRVAVVVAGPAINVEIPDREREHDHQSDNEGANRQPTELFRTEWSAYFPRRIASEPESEGSEHREERDGDPGQPLGAERGCGEFRHPAEFNVATDGANEDESRRDEGAGTDEGPPQRAAGGNPDGGCYCGSRDAAECEHRQRQVESGVSLEDQSRTPMQCGLSGSAAEQVGVQPPHELAAGLNSSIRQPDATQKRWPAVGLQRRVLRTRTPRARWTRSPQID